MKQINFLPKPTFIEQHKGLLIALVTCILCIAILLYGVFNFLGQKPSTPFDRVLNPSQTATRSSKHSISKLQMVGYLCQAEKANADSCWCLVKAPDGEVSTLKIGDFVGYEKAKVTDIKPLGIYLSVPQKKDLIFIRAALPQQH